MWMDLWLSLCSTNSGRSFGKKGLWKLSSSLHLLVLYNNTEDTELAGVTNWLIFSIPFSKDLPEPSVKCMMRYEKS